MTMVGLQRALGVASRGSRQPIRPKEAERQEGSQPPPGSPQWCCPGSPQSCPHPEEPRPPCGQQSHQRGPHHHHGETN